MRTCSILGGVLLISLLPMFLVLFVIGTGILTVIQIYVVVALAAVIRYLDIVVGTHGRTDFDRYVFGSVTEYLVRTTPIPVLTVRGSNPETVERKLEALEKEGLIESKTFGNERVWVVPDDNGDHDSPNETPMPTDTRVPPVK